MDAVGLLRVEVVDSGAGIAVEDQKKVFGQFAQFNRNELQGGGSVHPQSVRLLTPLKILLSPRFQH